MSQPKFLCHNSISVQVMFQHYLVLSAFFCRDPKSFSRQRLVATELDFLLQPCYVVVTWILCVCQIFAVATQISCRDSITLCSAYLFCRDPVCYVVTGLLCICVETSIVTQKVCCDGVLLQLSLFPCCSFIFYVAIRTFMLGMFYMSRPQICYVTTTLFCMQHIFLSRPSFSGHDITFLPSA